MIRAGNEDRELSVCGCLSPVCVLVAFVCLCLCGCVGCSPVCVCGSFSPVCVLVAAFLQCAHH